MADPIIVWNTRDPLSGRTGAEYEAELKRILAGRVQAAYFFGSYGTPEFGRDSDIDLILVVDTATPFLDRALDFPEVLDLVPSTDLLVYTPAEFASLTTDPSPGFWTSVAASLRRIM
ncbi:MAG: nucleotidyltransferase domain-containing protein [Treponema sp.]|nr:nucleotidyltransferase domain-containing protein [Treponema sp.]